jgi:membrane-bound lytic murein transglycosylase D
MAPFIAMAETIYETEPDEAAQLAEMISNTRDEYVTGLGKKTHIVKGGENISSIARKYKVQVNDVKRWNNLRNNTVRAGQKLTVYAPVKQKIESKPPVKQGATEPSVDAVANPTQPPVSDSLAAGKSSSSDTTQVKPVQTATKKPSTEFIYHTIQPGDTLWNIARRYDGVTVEKLKEMNKITDASALVPGTRIKVKVKG